MTSNSAGLDFNKILDNSLRIFFKDAKDDQGKPRTAQRIAWMRTLGVKRMGTEPHQPKGLNTYSQKFFICF